jgi:predicted nucleic acid-binding protein
VGGLRVLLDSCILIDHFNGREEATAYLARVEGEASLSVITRAEVLAGFSVFEAATACGLLDRFPTLPVEQPVADIAARMRHEGRIKIPDALQAAMAQYLGMQLATRNTRDFPPEKFPFVIVPY